MTSRIGRTILEGELDEARTKVATLAALLAQRRKRVLPISSTNKELSRLRIYCLTGES